MEISVFGNNIMLSLYRPDFSCIHTLHQLKTELETDTYSWHGKEKEREEMINDLNNLIKKWNKEEER